MVAGGGGGGGGLMIYRPVLKHLSDFISDQCFNA